MLLIWRDIPGLLVHFFPSGGSQSDVSREAREAPIPGSSTGPVGEGAPARSRMDRLFLEIWLIANPAFLVHSGDPRQVAHLLLGGAE